MSPLAWRPAPAPVLNSVMLYHAVQAGLDMAIVNPAQITPYAEIPAEERELAEDLIFNRRPDALHPPDRALSRRSDQPVDKAAARSGS